MLNVTLLIYIIKFMICDLRKGFEIFFKYLSRDVISLWFWIHVDMDGWFLESSAFDIHRQGEENERCPDFLVKKALLLENICKFGNVYESIYKCYEF